MTSFEAKEEEECLLMQLRRTTSACYRLGYCDVLVNRVYKPKCDETSQEISPMVRNRDLFFGATVNFVIKYFLNEETEGVLADTLMNFHDWHLTWLSQLKPNVKVGQSL